MLRKSTLVTLTCVSRSQTQLVDVVLEPDTIARHQVQEQKHVIGRAVSGKIGNNMLIARGHVDLDNDAINARGYKFISEHSFDELDNELKILNGKLSSVIMQIYLRKNKLTHLMPHNWEELEPLMSTIRKQANGEEVKSSWFNILLPNTKIDDHSHVNSKTTQGATYAAFVYYSQLPEGATPIELLIDNEWVPIPAQTGDWMCFDLECRHRVPLNMSDQHRISFAFNT